MQGAQEAGIELSREMGITHADFRRLLPSAAPGCRVLDDGDRLQLSVPGSAQWVSIELGPQQERCIGALRLPVTAVKLRCNGFDADGRADFIRRFDLAYQRGGG